jgi:NhaP-type Na+/H+ or K+/H+ antiporter
MDHVNYILVLLIGLLCAVAAVAGLARRFAVSYPIVLVVFGLLCSLLPHIPHVPLPPSLVFLVILPPLLYTASWQTSWREFKYTWCRFRAWPYCWCSSPPLELHL